jgi:uncharacterized protein (DUF342 family)
MEHPLPADSPGFDLAQDASKATLLIPRGATPEQLESERLLDLAREVGLLITDELCSAIQRAVASFAQAPREVAAVVAAVVPPINGCDGRLEWAEGYEPLERCQPALRGDGRVDHYECLLYLPVRSGTRVARVHPPQPGRDGHDVKGRRIKASSGRACPMRFDAGFTVGEDGSIVAQRSGLLEVDKNLVKLTPVFDVAGSIDFATGNVDFDGSVTVREGICDRFVVKASGNVVAQGLVQGATIECGGNFVCAMGMAARGRGRVNVAGTLEAGYLDGVSGRIGGDLVARRELIGCHLVVGGLLRAESAGMIGGEIGVSGAASLAKLGSRSGKLTTIMVGHDALRLLQARRLRTEAEEVEARLSESRATTERLTSARRAPELEIRLAALAEEQRRLAAQLKALQDMEWQITCQEATPAGPSILDVTGVIHPGSTLVMGAFEAIFDRTLQGPVRLMGPDELTLQHPSGARQPLDQVARISRRME